MVRANRRVTDLVTDVSVGPTYWVVRAVTVCVSEGKAPGGLSLSGAGRRGGFTSLSRAPRGAFLFYPPPLFRPRPASRAGPADKGAPASEERAIEWREDCAPGAVDRRFCHWESHPLEKACMRPGRNTRFSRFSRTTRAGFRMCSCFRHRGIKRRRAFALQVASLGLLPKTIMSNTLPMGCVLGCGCSRFLLLRSLRT
jgi:hypothetical protein